MLSCFCRIKNTDIDADLEYCKSLSLTDTGQGPKKHTRHFVLSNAANRPSDASSAQKDSLDRQDNYLPPGSFNLLMQHDADWKHLKSSTADILSDVSVAILAPNLSPHSARGVQDLRCIYASSKLIADVSISQAEEYSQLLSDAIHAGDELLDFFLDRAIQALLQSTMKEDRMRKCIVTAPGPLEGMLLELELCRWIPEDNAMQPLSRNVQPALLIRHIRMNHIIKASPDCSRKVTQSLAAGVAGSLPALITLCDLQGQVLYQVRMGKKEKKSLG